MKTTKASLALGIFLLAAHSAPATPFNEAEVAKDAKWFLHADLDSLRRSSMGQLAVGAIEDKHEDKLKAVKRMFSLNPVTDLQAITLWGPGQKDQGVVLIRGSFDRPHLEDLIGAADEHSTTQHQSHTIHTWTDKKAVQHGAFVGGDLAIMGRQKELIAHALDVLDGSSPAMEKRPPQGPSALLLGLVDLEGIDLPGKEAKLIEKAQTLEGRVFEEADHMHMQGIITANNAQDALRIQRILEGMIAMSELAHEELQDLQLKSAIRIEGDTTVHASLSIANEMILQVLEEAGDLKQILEK